MNAASRSWFINLKHCSWFVSMVGLTCVGVAQDYLSVPDYRNTIYDPAPAIPGASLTQAQSVAVFNGSVGRAGGTNTPNDGSLYLWRTVIGQPVGGHTARIPGERTYRFGEIIFPFAALGVDGTVAPASIDPPEGARFIPGL